jgi:membrane protein required for colicin V production
MLAGQPGAGEVPPAVIFGGVLVASGIALGALMRAAVAAVIGPIVGLPDRLAGAMLGAGRIGLVAVVLVLVLDRIIPPHLQPRFLAESRLRPVLSTAAAAGLKTLPPEIETFIDRLKRDRGF